MSILKNSQVEILSAYDERFFEEKLISFGYPINKNQDKMRTHVDWDKLNGYSFYYDYVGNDEIGDLLKRSQLCNPDHAIILELNPGNPIISIDSFLFAELWEDIINENSFGISGLTTDGRWLFEFTDDSKYLLYSNFEIKGNTPR